MHSVKTPVFLRITVLVGLILFPASGEAQRRGVDTPSTRFLLSEADSNRIKSLVDLTYEHRGTDRRKAFAYAREALSLAEQLPDKRFAARTLVALGWLYNDQREYDSADSSFERAWKLATECREGLTILRALLGLAQVQQDRGRWELVVPGRERALAAAESLNDRLEIAYALSNLAFAHYNTNKFSEASEIGRKGLKLLEELGDTSGMAFSLNNLGNVAEATGQYDEAMDCYRRGLKLYEQMGDRKMMAMALNNIGIMYEHQGKYEQSMEVHLRSLKMREDLGVQSDIAGSYANIASVFEVQGRYDKSLEYYEKSMRIYEELGDERNVAGILVNMSLLDNRNRKYDQAESRLRKALRVAEQLDDKFLMTFILPKLAGSYARNNRFDEALDMFRRCHQLSVDLGDIRGRADALNMIAWAQMNLWNYDSAVSAATQAYALARQSNAVELLHKISLNLSEIHEARDDHASALKYYREYSARKDSLLNEANQRSINEMTARYESEKKQRQIDQLRKEKEFQEYELERRRKEIVIRQLESERNRQQAALTARDRDRKMLELDKRTVELELRTKQLELQKNEKEKAQSEKYHQASIASRETSLRNALLAGIVLFVFVAFLGIKRIQARRMEASLRAEAAEYQARAVEAEMQQAQHEMELQKLEAQQEFSRQLLVSQEEERSRIAAELHDQFGQDLVVIRNSILVSMKNVNGHESLMEAVRTSGAMLENVRRMTRDLRPFQLDRYGLTNALIAMIARVGKSSATRFTTEIDPLDGLLPKDGEINLYRIVQEAVNNIVKHADAMEATVRIVVSEDVVELVIEDNGKGFPDKELQYGFGLHGIEQRTMILRGRMQLGSRQGGGARIMISIPRENDVADATAHRAEGMLHG